MIRSMTGFATQAGAAGPHSWTWELRAVNGRGLDLRVRVPDWLPGLEDALRKRLTAAIGRGNVTLGLRIQRAEGAGELAINEAQLAAVLTAVERIEAAAMDRGVALAPSRASDLAAMRGVLEQRQPEDDNAALAAQLAQEAEQVIAAFNAMRSAEGAALHAALSGQIDSIEALTAQARTDALARQHAADGDLRRALARVIDNVDGIDPARIEQELAMIAVKADITEEIDRLQAHVAAARALLAESGPVGRKLDFLTQEFNREANTLCAKAQNAALTRTGLALKAVIEQFREQVQNVE